MASEGANQVKKQTLGDMLGFKTAWTGGKLLNCYTPLVLIHAHLLLDLNGLDRGEVKDWLRDRHNKSPRQVEVRGIRLDQTLPDLCRKIGSYPFKDRVQYNMSFEAHGYRDGRYFSDLELANLLLLHGGVCRNGFKNLLIGSKWNG